jgi:hypothetical protein
VGLPVSRGEAAVLPDGGSVRRVPGGSHGIWHDGWKAITTHPTLSGWSDFNDDTWELYHTDTDRAELHNLAAEHPGKLRELVNLWFAEAGNNAAFPLDDRSAVEIITTPRPQLATPSDRDSGEPVTDDYPGDHPHAFTGGTIKRVVVDVSGDPYLNLEREAQAMLARE